MQDKIAIPCEECPNKDVDHIFDSTMKIKVFWCRACGYARKPVYREWDIKPVFRPVSQDTTTA